MGRALAPHLVRRTYSEPRWDAGRGAAMASERVTLYGLPIVAARPVLLSRADPALARELFIMHALVDGDWVTHHAFVARNSAALADARNLERKSRTRGIVADDAALFDFYASRIPADVVSARHFDAWWKKAKVADPELLTLTPADLAGPAAAEVDQADYPDTLAGLELHYEFAPGEPEDGVSVSVPLARLADVPENELSWLVPGLRAELVTELIRSLPKQLRTRFVPAPDVARQVLARLDPGQSPGGKGGAGGLPGALAAELSRLGGAPVPPDAFDLAKLPRHLRVRFQVTGDDGAVLADGEDLATLRADLAPKLRARIAAAAPADLARTGITQWDFDSLPREFADGQVRAYPALADAGDSVQVVLAETDAQARESMRRGNRRLLLLAVPSGARAVASRLPSAAKLALSRSPYRSPGALLDDCAAAAADQIIAVRGGPAWDRAAFTGLLEAARLELRALTADVVSAAATVMARAHEVEAGLDRSAGAAALGPAVADLRAQFGGLVHDGFIAETGAGRLKDLERYLRAMSYRLERARLDVDKDTDRTAVVRRVSEEYERTLRELGQDARLSDPARSVRWMIEELRVSLFAQSLGTAFPVSERRIDAALARLRDG